MVVLNPLKLTITNWPKGKVEYRSASNNPNDPSQGSRMVPFSGELYIERDDFMEDPPKKFFRLSIGREVRLRFGYYVTCNEVIKDEQGNPIELLCTYDPETSGGKAPDGRKVKATLHWVEASNCLDGTAITYDRLFRSEHPDTSSDVFQDLNQTSLTRFTSAKFEPSINELEDGDVIQFERLGYFCKDGEAENLFHRTVGLRDEWANIQKRKNAN